MIRESLYELQRIDCNCNDCRYMERDMKRIPVKGQAAKINYGHCTKFDKAVSFISGVCQIETQHCFTHRKDHP